MEGCREAWGGYPEDDECEEYCEEDSEEACEDGFEEFAFDKAAWDGGEEEDEEFGGGEVEGEEGEEEGDDYGEEETWDLADYGRGLHAPGFT